MQVHADRACNWNFLVCGYTMYDLDIILNNSLCKQKCGIIY